MTRSILRRAAAATTVVGLALVGAVAGVAAPASAAFYAVEGDPVVWTGFDDTSGYIDDAYFDYDIPGYLQGWTGDAFDGIGTISITDCSAGTGSVSPCLLYTSPSPRDRQKSRMPSSA